MSIHHTLSHKIKGPVAIDGPAASGKSTVAKRVAKEIGGFYISTGDMYRAVSWAANHNGIDPVTDTQGLVTLLREITFDCAPGEDGSPRLRVNGAELTQTELHSPAVAANVSQVSAIPAVREWLADYQRSATRFGLVVLEGRDIGTVIFPDAPHKFFLTATPEERARRRLAQGGDIPEGATIESVARDIADRDYRDSTRSVAPLRAADDAILIDSSTLTIDQVVDMITTHIARQSDKSA
ncbi:MAG: (d)CMP kinase [Lentisphaeria bacterium]|nr:(d)CMP kinase [Lentisphaeria bacterium]